MLPGGNPSPLLPPSMPVPSPPTLETGQPQQRSPVPQPSAAVEASAKGSQQLADAPMPQDHVVTLASATVINQRAFVNNCGLPFGALIDFRPADSLGLRTVHGRLAPRCRGCSAFLHVYCKTSTAKSLWRCTFCELVNTAPDVAFGDVQAHPELTEEGVDFVYDPPSPPRLPPPLHLVLAIDATLDAHTLQSLSTALLSALEGLDPASAVSVVSFDAAVALHAMGPDRRCSLAVPGGRPLDPELVQFYTRSGGLQLSAPLGECLPYLGEVLATIRVMAPGTPQQRRPRCSGVALEASLVMLTTLLSHAVDGLPSPSTQGAAPAGRVLLFVGGPITRGAGYVPLEALEGQDRDKAAVRALEEGLKYSQTLGRTAAAVGSTVDVFIGVRGAVNAPLLLSLARSSGGEASAHEGFGPLFGGALAAALGRRLGDHATLDCCASEGVRLVQWMGPVDVLKLPSDPRILYDRRLSGNACSVSAFEMGRGAGLRLELTHDLKGDEDVYLQVVLRYNEPRSGRLVTRVVTRRMGVVGGLADYLASLNPLAAAALLGKKLALDSQKAAAARDPRRAEEVRLATGALLNLIATRCGRQVQASRGLLLGFGAKRLWLLPAELVPLAQALYHLQRGRLLGWQGGSHADDRTLLTERLISAAAGTTFRSLTPQLYVLDSSALTTRSPSATGSERPWVTATSGQAPELLHVPSVNLAVKPYRTYVLDSGTSFAVVTPSELLPAPDGRGAGGEGRSEGGARGNAAADASPTVSPTKSSPAVLQPGGTGPESTARPANGAEEEGGDGTAPSGGSAGGDEAEATPLSMALAAAGRAAAGRFPGPDVCCMAQDAPGAYAAFWSRLTPAHRDSLPEQRAQVAEAPSVAQLSNAELTALAPRYWAMPQDPSFVQWCQGVGVQPFSPDAASKA